MWLESPTNANATWSSICLLDTLCRSVLSNQSAYEALRTGKGWMNEVLEIADECNLNVEDLQNAIEQQGMKEARVR